MPEKCLPPLRVVSASNKLPRSDECRECIAGEGEVKIQRSAGENARAAIRSAARAVRARATRNQEGAPKTKKFCMYAMGDSAYAGACIHATGKSCDVVSDKGTFRTSIGESWKFSGQDECELLQWHAVAASEFSLFERLPAQTGRLG